MKFWRISLTTVALTIAANGLMAASPTSGWADQWFKAKHGRSSPSEEARQKAELANTAFREETPVNTAAPAPDWTEQYFKVKYGRSSPSAETRQKAELANTAFREETTADSAPPALNWTEQYFRAKWGRDISAGPGKGSTK